MPRGVKKSVNYDEELMKIDAQITRWTNTIKELQDKKTALLNQKEQKELSELKEVVESSGMTVHDLMQMVQHPEAAAESENCMNCLLYTSRCV